MRPRTLPSRSTPIDSLLPEGACPHLDLALACARVHALILSGLVLALVPAWGPARAQEWTPNYDESEVPDYELPDPLTYPDGTPVETAEEWREQRRAQVLELFREHVYGTAPGRPDSTRYEVLESDAEALGGRASRTQIRIHLENDGRREDVELLLYLPTGVKRAVPVFLGINFYGNHTVHPDPNIVLHDEWVANNERFGITDHRANEASRGERSYRWPVETILAYGYGLANIYYGDVDPDRNDFDDGVHPLFYESGQTRPDSGEWGAIGAWAWGLSRAQDYLETDDEVAGHCTTVIGHSRLGKTALWAGARDERFALVIGNDSGAGGAALSRRRYGETVWRINTSFPHWFAPNFHRYNENEDALPVDQHMLLALSAPRPVYVGAAQEDRWADPRGMFLAALHASPVYELLGAGGLAAEEMPSVYAPIHSTIGFHVRAGEHDLKDYDWRQYLTWADRRLDCS